MNNDLYTDQVLDDYLFGKINLDEAGRMLDAKEDMLVTEMIRIHQVAAAALQRNAVIRQVANVHIQFLASLPKRTMLPSSNEESPVVAIRKTNFYKWVLRIAAVLLLAVSSWYTWQFSTNSSNKLYSEMYQAYNVNTNRAGIGEIVPHNMISQYKNRDYQGVISTYNSLPVTTNREKFLTAMAYHEISAYQQSVGLLTQIVHFNEQNKSRLYNDEADFYIALNYLKMKNGKAALPWFQKIYNTPTHTFNERVTKWTITRLKWLR